MGIKENEPKLLNTFTKEFVDDYNNIVHSNNLTVTIHTEWSSKGDFFQKLSIYDNNYVPVQTLGNTTLINNL